MGRHAETERRLAAAVEILEAEHPMTVRQLYYRLVSRQVIENNRSAYQAVSNLLVEARKSGEVPWEWVEDRLRRPRHVAMWSDAAEFLAEEVPWYRRNVWESQARRVECWLEKDALSGIFEDVLEPYGVTLNVGRGFDGWDSIHNASKRLGAGDVVLYFGDFDPSGEDMVRSLRERLAELGSEPELVKCALTAEDVRLFNLPTDFTKKSDTRSRAFVEKHGDVAVELDALPTSALRERLEDEVQARMDLEALQRTRTKEKRERARLERLAREFAP